MFLEAIKAIIQPYYFIPFYKCNFFAVKGHDFKVTHGISRYPASFFICNLKKYLYFL